jgi:hypothetical protein
MRSYILSRGKRGLGNRASEGENHLDEVIGFLALCVLVVVYHFYIRRVIFASGKHIEIN